jgi:hypothetical protein
MTKETGSVSDDQEPQKFEKFDGAALHHSNPKGFKALSGGRRLSTGFPSKYAGFTLCQHSCEGRLATLARAKESRNRVHVEGTGDVFEGFWSWYHSHIISLKIGMSSNDFQG